jgi:hypothetical protein
MVGTEGASICLRPCFQRQDQLRKRFAIDQLQTSDVFSSAASVWSGLVSLRDLNLSRLPIDQLVALGSILCSVWRYYWDCILSRQSWHPLEAQAVFCEEHAALVANTPSNIG